LLGAELMNVSLLAMSNSLAESFIIVNSIFFGVSDIGISTVVQQAAFYGLINQGNLKELLNLYRNVLLDRIGGDSDRLVDCFKRNRFLPCILGNYVIPADRKLSRIIRCHHFAGYLHSPHLPDEVFGQVRSSD
jgi:hypothetical protein